MACIVIIGLLGCEWIPDYLRGGWIFYCLLVISGVFLYISQALVLGLLTFVGLAFYLFYKLQLGQPAEKQTLMLFLAPMAPIWLSAIKHNLKLVRTSRYTLIAALQKSKLQLLNLEAYEDFQHRIASLCRGANAISYFEVIIYVKNQALIANMLGDQSWQEIRIRMVDILAATRDEPVFHFANEEMTYLRSIHLALPLDFHEDLPFIGELRQISGLKIEVEYKHTLLASLDKGRSS